MKRLFVLGDSISIQYGPYLESFLRGRFEYDRKRGSTENLDAGLGANGGDSRHVLGYLRECTRSGSFKADILLLNCGLHDIKVQAGRPERQIDLATYEGNLRAIIDECEAAGWRPVWVRTTPVDDAVHAARMTEFLRYSADVARYNESADALMTERRIPVIDLHHFTAKFLPEGFADHVHFTPEVQRLQAAFIAGSLEQIAGRF